MRLINLKVPAPHVLLIASLAVFTTLMLNPQKTRAQQKGPAAEIGVGSPLPVWVVNEPSPRLPQGFVAGTSWKFTTWTVPSTLTFTATVQRVDGGWAYLTVNTETPAATRWYYIPYMPGAWEPQ